GTDVLLVAGDERMDGRIEPRFEMAAETLESAFDGRSPGEPSADPPPGVSGEADFDRSDDPLLASQRLKGDNAEPWLADQSLSMPQRGLEPGPVLDARLDCIVELPLAGPVMPERLLSAAGALRRVGTKPVAIEADTGNGRWIVPTAASGALQRVRAGVLLANRTGPLNAMEFSEFESAVTALGVALGAGGAILPAMSPVLDHARRLDDFCAALDALIGANIETPTALSNDELAALARSLGLAERGSNRYVRLGEAGEVIFSLSFGERAEQLTLLLDVPRAPITEQPWKAMIDCARRCAQMTGGQLVDDAQRPLSTAQVAVVSRQLEERYDGLSRAGLAAGSSAALRVFN
ncbi:MAG: cell division protein ZipA C-terminal FtsZ-binding domain-containing protein, partial [Burkholderiales bacterium]